MGRKRTLTDRVRGQVRAARAGSAIPSGDPPVTSPVRPPRRVIVRAADVQPVRRPVREFALREGDAVTGRPVVLRDGSVMVTYGIVVSGPVDSVSGGMCEVLWSSGRLTVALVKGLRKVVEEPDL